MKRFISGAICPKCNQPDKIYVLKEADCASRHCVNCGFEDQLTEVVNAGLWEPVRIDPQPPESSGE